MRALILTIIALFSAPADAREGKMDNKQIVRAIYEDYINRRQLDRLNELFSADYAGPQGQTGPSAFAANVASLLRGFPDIKFTLEDVIAEGDRVVVRWMWQGTHDGDFRGYAPTGKRARSTGTVIYQFKDGKITRSWLETDRLGVLQQIGIIPADLGVPARRGS